MAIDESTTLMGHYVQANGLQIYYEEYGRGVPLLLIHEGVDTLSMWAPHIPTFARHFRVIAPDSRGHGRTKNPAEQLSYRLMAEDMAAFICALELNKPFVCGYSDGGQIALELGIHYPHLAQGYIMCGAQSSTSLDRCLFYLPQGVGDGESAKREHRTDRTDPARLRRLFTSTT